MTVKLTNHVVLLPQLFASLGSMCIFDFLLPNDFQRIWPSNLLTFSVYLINNIPETHRAY